MIPRTRVVLVHAIWYSLVKEFLLIRKREELGFLPHHALL